MYEDITSPPFPPETATSTRLLTYLDGLREWVLSNRDELNTVAGKDVIPYPREIPTPESYAAVSVVDKYITFGVVRRIREGWDQLLRAYEDNWTDDAAIAARTALVKFAASIFNEAFIDSETREAKNVTERKEFERWSLGLKEALENLVQTSLKPQERDDDDEVRPPWDFYKHE